MTTPDLDLTAAHRFFSSDCFNKAWELIEKPERTPEDDTAMLHLSIAALWHWTQRDDCTDKNISIGCWQVARIYALLGLPDEARRYALRSLEAAKRGQAGPFYEGYAYESLARAESLANRPAEAARLIAEARRCAALVTDEAARASLLDDLAKIG